MNQIISERTAMEMYDDMLNDCSGPVTIGSMSFDASYALERIDPVAYRVGFDDYVSSLTEDDIFVEGMTDMEMDSELEAAE